MIVNTDIDIDVADREKLLSIIKHVPACMEQDGKFKKHNTGVYFHEVPVDPATGLCTVDYKEAENIGFFKIDVLNVGIYKNIQTRNELDELLEHEPMWELLEHEEIVNQCFHIHNHYNIVKKMKPQTVEQLAAVLAIIRPGKRHLLGKSWDDVFAEVWQKPSDDTYYFKKAHAISYATAIVLQLNMLVKNLVLQD